MKIAIHKSKGFYERWVSYCEENKIPYKIVNAYDSDIIEQLNDCTAFMWHHHHADYRDCLFANQLLYSLQKKGLKVFPDFNTTWHFDDKVGQKYLLESLDAPIVSSYVFYTKKDALTWINKTSFPKVFKLRGGAGAANVRLVKNKNSAKRLINKMFGRGISPFNRIGNIKEKIRQYKAGKNTIFGICKSFGRFFIPTEFAKMHYREKGYVYFQDFIPNNAYDIRVIVIGDRAFAIKRMCRKNDFRASGSGNIIYRKEEIDERCVKIAFDVNSKLKSQSFAVDFVFDNSNPLITEISYGFVAKGYDICEGYWDANMNWYEGKNFDFCGWMVEEVY